MTIEAVLIVLVLLLALIKALQLNVFSKIQLPKKSEVSVSNLIDRFLFFAINVVFALTITDEIIVMVLISSIVWSVFHYHLKAINYNVLAWFSLVLYIAFVSATHTFPRVIDHTEIWYFTIFCWTLTAIYILIYESLGRLVKYLTSLIVWITGTIILLFPICYIVYAAMNEVTFGTLQLNAILQTNWNEAFEYLLAYIPAFVPILIIILLVSFLIILLISESKRTTKLSGFLFFYLSLVSIFLINLNSIKYLIIPNQLVSDLTIYFEELAKFREIQSERQSGFSNLKATKQGEKELYIVVIGESHNKNHMSLYGYHRNTTPLLDDLHKNGELIKLDDAFSTHTHTIPVLVKALTNSNFINQEKYSEAASILDVLESADFDTYWLTNQIKFGGWDNPVSVLAQRADYNYQFNNLMGAVSGSSQLDGTLFIKLDSILSKGIEQNTIIFMHLMGSHSIYEQRYPQNEKIFSGALEKYEYGNNDYSNYYVNHYDNSVAYNHKLIFHAIERLKERNNVSACIYFADHSEDVFNELSHEAAKFTYSMVQIPTLLWMSDPYKELYPKKFKTIQKNSSRLFSSDGFHDLIIGLTGVETSLYSPQLDLFNEGYELPIESCDILEGHRNYGNTENFYYHIQQNSKKVISLNMEERVFPHRVNTLGKLSETIYRGMNSFEVDVVFKSDSNHFEIGHDNSALSGMSLETFLNFPDSGIIKKIWLDIKNFNKENSTQISERLLELDERFNLKEKMIVESGTRDLAFSKLSNLGFHTSYYLPTNYILENENNWKPIALELSGFVKQQNVNAISFDARLYPFVKDHLENQISNKIIYHTWDMSLNFGNPGLLNALNKTDYFQDNRINSILIPYKSNFDL